MDFNSIKSVAVVGISDNPDKASFRVAKYLQDNGFKIIPVNPAIEEVLGEKSYQDIASIPENLQVDAVDIFRRPDAVLPIVEQAVSRDDIKVIWMQEGIINKDAAELAEKAGKEVIMDKCMLKEHQKLLTF